VGVRAAQLSSYSLQSRAIGEGTSLGVSDLAYAGGSVTNNGLLRAPRRTPDSDPSGTTSWKVKLTVTEGEALLSHNKAPCHVQRVMNVSRGFAGGRRCRRSATSSMSCCRSRVKTL